MPIIPVDHLDDINYHLLVAAKDGSLDLLKKLVANGANIHHRDPDNGSVLHMAILNGHAACASYLAGLGVNIHETSNNGTTLLHIAAIHGDLSCVQFLVEQGLDLLATNDSAATPLTCAEINGQKNVANYLRDCLKSKREFESLNLNIKAMQTEDTIHF